MSDDPRRNPLDGNRIRLDTPVYNAEGVRGNLIGYGYGADYLVRFEGSSSAAFYEESDIYLLSLPERVARIEKELGLTNG